MISRVGSHAASIPANYRLRYLTAIMGRRQEAVLISTAVNRGTMSITGGAMGLAGKSGEMAVDDLGYASLIYQHSWSRCR